MDIAQFNIQLKEKISSANRSEKRKEWEDAIKRWIEVSELTLNTSKRADIEFTFRSMLIQKTEQIIEHVKELKMKARAPPISHIDSNAKVMVDEEQPLYEAEEVGPSEEGIEKKGGISISEDDKIPAPEKKPPSTKQIIDSDLKNLPEGFKEIKPDQDFKILAPHDEEYIQNLLKQESEHDLFVPQNKVDSKTELSSEDIQIKLDKTSDSGEVICFACGHENPPGTKICRACGTQL